MIKVKHKLIIAAIIGSASFWLMDAIIDRTIFDKRPFLDQLIFNIPAHEIYMRLLSIICLILFVFLISRYIIKSKESESRYQHLFDNIYDAIFVMHLTDERMPGKIIETNDEACKRLGYSREELFNLSVKDFNAPEQVPHIPARVQRLLAEGHVIFETVLVAKDGRRIPVETNAHLVDFKGKPTILAIARDITVRLQAQEALQNAHEELEQRVIERTAALTQVNRQLQRETEEHRLTAEALKESEQKLRRLATRLLTAQEDTRRRMAQELQEEMGQTLLAMKLQIGSIKDELLKEKQRDQESLVTDCDQLLQHFRAMVDNIRRLSRDLSPVILEELGLAAAVKNLFEEFSNNHQHIKTSVNIDEIGDVLPLQDQINIFRICQESLTNIGKHSHPTQLSLAIKKRGGRVSFAMEDNGRGIDLHGALPQEPPAQDLGLAAVDERVRILGGVLRIERQEGQGTRLTFEVPVKGRGVFETKPSV